MSEEERAQLGGRVRRANAALALVAAVWITAVAIVVGVMVAGERPADAVLVGLGAALLVVSTVLAAQARSHAGMLARLARLEMGMAQAAKNAEEVTARIATVERRAQTLSDELALLRPTRAMPVVGSAAVAPRPAPRPAAPDAGMMAEVLKLEDRLHRQIGKESS